MDLIKEPNPEIDKQLFLKSLADNDEPVRFKVLKVGNIYKSKMNAKLNFYIEMEVLTDFNCKVLELDLIGNPKLDSNGNKITKTVNINKQVVGLPFPIQPATEPDKYNVSNKTNLFPILNYAFIDKEIVPEGNQQGFNNVTFEEIKEALTGIEFLATAIYIETNYKYYKFVPVEE